MTPIVVVRKGDTAIIAGTSLPIYLEQVKLKTGDGPSSQRAK
ncbi:MAG: hypothetical protein ABIR98_13555 [Usitatibacter sp.]